MSRYGKILNSKVVGLGLFALAAYLLISEGVLWREKLLQSTQSLANPAGQPGEVNRSLDRGQDAGSGGDALASTTPLADLARRATFEQVTVPEGVFAYGGSTTWAPIRKDVDVSIQASSADFQLQYTGPAPDSGKAAGSGTGIQMLLDGELAFSQSSRALKAKERAAAQRQGYDLQQVAVAVDGIAIAVNPALDIPGLTMAQLQAIYTGSIQNWQEVGGPDAVIVPYARRTQDSGTAEFFAEAVLDGLQLGPNVQFAASTTVGIREVASNIGSIYYASAPEIVSQCSIRPLPLATDTGGFVPPYVSPYVTSSECPRFRNQLNTEQFQNGEYPITRELFVIVKQNGQIEEEIGVAYANLLLTDEGQALMEEAGFVKARDSQP